MTVDDLAFLVLRLAVGLTFAAHGAQKAFGWWGGPGPDKWTRSVGGMGFHPPVLFAFVSIAAELGAGLALAVGLLTPFAAAILVAQAVVIAVQVHLRNGFFATNGGIEFPFVLGAAALAITLGGPGSLSLDAVIGFSLAQPERIAVGLAGLAAGFVALIVARAARPSEQPLRRA